MTRTIAIVFGSNHNMRVYYGNGCNVIDNTIMDRPEFNNFNTMYFSDICDTLELIGMTEYGFTALSPHFAYYDHILLIRSYNCQADRKLSEKNDAFEKGKNEYRVYLFGKAR